MAEETTPARLGSVFSQTVVSNVLNPKVALLFLAFLPQFADPIDGGLVSQLLTLGLTFALLTCMIFSALGYFSGSLENRLASRPNSRTSCAG
jgi:threonine/homoserine/homoserine lactone efflux protein